MANPYAATSLHMSPTAEDSVTRLQYLLANSLNVLSESVQLLATRSPSEDPQGNIIVEDGQLSEAATKTEAESRAERMAMLIKLAYNEIENLPDSTVTTQERNNVIVELQQKSNEAEKELEELVATATSCYESIRQNLRLLTNAGGIKHSGTRQI